MNRRSGGAGVGGDIISLRHHTALLAWLSYCWAAVFLLFLLFCILLTSLCCLNPLTVVLFFRYFFVFPRLFPANLFSIKLYLFRNALKWMFLSAAAVVKTADEENKFQNSRPFYSFRASGCKLGFQTCLPAAPHPVSIFLQLVATHKNTCPLHTVQSR